MNRDFAIAVAEEDSSLMVVGLSIAAFSGFLMGLLATWIF